MSVSQTPEHALMYCIVLYRMQLRDPLHMLAPTPDLAHCFTGLLVLNDLPSQTTLAKPDLTSTPDLAHCFTDLLG